MGKIKRARLTQFGHGECSAQLKLLIHGVMSWSQWEDYFGAAPRNSWSKARSEKSIPSKRKAKEQDECFETQKPQTFHLVPQLAQWGFFWNFLLPVRVRVVDTLNNPQTTAGVTRAFAVSLASPQWEGSPNKGAYLKKNRSSRRIECGLESSWSSVVLSFFQRNREGRTARKIHSSAFRSIQLSNGPSGQWRL